LSGGFQQGYVASVLNQPYVAIESFINASYVERTGDPTINTDLLYILWSTLNIAFPTATILGQLIAAYLCNRIGRRQTAIVACILYLPGIALSMATKWLYPAFELLFVGRLLWSMANGICVVNQTVWIVEAAPVKHRGRMAAMQEVFMAVGKLL
jgi:MFS family permease